MGIETYQEKNTKPMEKELDQLDLPVRRKLKKKQPKNAVFHKSDIFGCFFGFFS